MNWDPKWTPPLLGQRKSPLIQEIYFPDRWKMLACCIMLNLTGRKQLDGIVKSFFEKYPDPASLLEADDEEIKELIKPLGMYNKRVKTLKRFSIEFLSEGWKNAIELHGIGKYGSDSDKIFYLGEWKEVEPTDGALISYMKFLGEHYGVDQ